MKLNRMKNILICSIALGLGAGWQESGAQTAAAQDTAVIKPAGAQTGESISPQGIAPEDLATYKERLESVNLGKSSDRIGFGGNLVTRGFDRKYLEFPKWLGTDAGMTLLDADLNLKLSVNANAYMKVWSMLSFGYDFSGHFQNNRALAHKRIVDVQGTAFPDEVPADRSREYTYMDPFRDGASIFEELMGGVDIKTDHVDATLRAGSALWVEGSPFTMWKRDPRPRLAWYYESYEPELSSHMYYTQKYYYRRNDLGRLSWPKKPFGGVELDAYKLPWGLGFQFDFAQTSNLLPTKTEGNYSGHPAEVEGLGSQNSMGKMYFARLHKLKAIRNITVGANLMVTQLPKDLIKQQIATQFASQGYIQQFNKIGMQPYFVNNRVFSIDGRGNLGPGLFLQADFGLTMDDTVKYLPVKDSLGRDMRVKVGNNPDTIALYNHRSATERKLGAPAPAAYIKLNSSGSLPSEAEFFFAAKRFWSPYAMTEYIIPVHRDEMKHGAGSFSYQSNLVGLNYKASPKMTNGFLVLTAGQHMQVEKGRDIVRFQHNLTGRDVWYMSHSWSRFEPGRNFDEGYPYGGHKYQGRMGDLGKQRPRLHGQGQLGGLRGDDLELWEEFVAYENEAQADSGIVPEHQKYAATLAMDWGHNINHWFNYERPVMPSLYAAVSSVATDLSGIANTDKTLLWSAYGRFEMAASLSPSFQVLAMTGAELWKSEKAYINKKYNATAPYYEPISVSTDGLAIEVDAAPSPIDYLQLAYGVGFDWDYAERAGLHVRAKYATHEDKNLPGNNWTGTFLFAETKIWF